MNLRKGVPLLLLRWMSILIGVVILFWLPIEDKNLTVVTFLAVAICFLGVSLAEQYRSFTLLQYVLTSFLGGLFVGPIGFVLIMVKIGLHSHGTPDFTINQLLQLLELSPIWAISGILLRLGAYFYGVFRRQ